MRTLSGILSLLFAASAAAAQPLTKPVVVVKNANQPQLALDPDGNPAVVFFHEGNVRVAFSTDHGKTFSEPVTAIDAEGRAAGLQQRGPRIAIDRSRRIFVTAPLPLNKKGTGPIAFLYVNDIFFAVSTDKGKTFSKPVMVNDTVSTAGQSLHRIAVTPGGDLHVAWLDNRKGKGQSLAIAKVNYRTKKPPKTKIVVDQACESCAPGIAVGSGGAPILAYREGGKKKDRRVFVGKIGGRTRRRLFQKKDDSPKGFIQITDVPSGVSVCPLDSPAVAVGPDGATIAVAWMDPRDGTAGNNVFWTYGRLGKLPREHYTHAERRFTQGRPTLVFDDAGTAWCAWEDGRGEVQQVYAVRSSRANNDFPVSAFEEGKGSSPSLAAGGGYVAVAYEADDNIHLRILAAPE